MHFMMMGLHVPNSLCICLWRKSSPFQFLIFFSASDRPQRLGHCWRQGSHLPLFFCHSSLCQGTFPNHFHSITLFNPYHMLVGVSYGFCGIDEETEGLHNLPSVTGLIKGRPRVPVCPLSSMSLSTLPQLKWKERDAGPGTSPLVPMYQGQVPTLGRSLTPMGYIYKDTCGTSIF